MIITSTVQKQSIIIQKPYEAYLKNDGLTSSSENPKKGWVASHIPESATPSHLFVKEPRLNSHRTPQAAETSLLGGGG